MRALTGIATFRLLFQNQWRTSRRAVFAQQGIFMWVVLGVIAFYAAFTLFIVGYFFDSFAYRMMPNEDPLRVANRYLLAAFISLFFLRFLFQRTPRMKIAPYLHLPISRKRLIAFFQASSLLSLHNLYPLVFFIPFWVRFVLPSDILVGQIYWLVSNLGLIVGSHFANLLLRGILKRYQGAFYALMILFIFVVIIDETAQLQVIQGASLFLFGHMLAGGFTSFALVLCAVAGLALTSTLVLRQSIKAPRLIKSRKRTRTVNIQVPKRFGLTGQLILLELLLLWRNRRPRHYLFVSVLFSTMYLILMMAAKSSFDGRSLDALIGLFASGGFVLNYGQLMFSWDSTYFDGILARNFPIRTLIRAKIVLLQISCLVFFLLSIPLFLWFRPELLPLHVAFLIYNAGITTILIMELASRNHQAVDIEKSGSFFNYEGFSARHWLWFIPTALPPVLFMVVMSAQVGLALLILAGLGGASLLASEFWIRVFEKGLTSRKYKMAHGFRMYAR